MKSNKLSTVIFISVIILINVILANKLHSCSTFMLEKDDNLIFAHNLDQGNEDIPGLIFVNKRNIFKQGKTLEELMSKETDNISNETWISRYGSITFSVFGKDLIDGGMNEEGLFIWEKSYVMTENLKNDNLPKLFSANWMQYILDNYSSVEEVLKSATEFELDGFSWHFFLADKKGDCASIEYIDGKTVIYTKDQMPVTGLFNNAYEQEKELLSYYKGFGGEYEVSLNSEAAPRFVRTALLINNYTNETSIIDYGFKMLSNLSGENLSQWSVIFDPIKYKAYFRTNTFPKIKEIDISKLDFSNDTVTQFLNIHQVEEADVTDKFRQFSLKDNEKLIKRLPLPENLKTSGGLTLEEFNSKMSSHYLKSHDKVNHYFSGKWSGIISVKHEIFNKYYPNLFTNDNWEILLSVNKNIVSGEITNSKSEFDKTPIKNLRLNNGKISFTMRTGRAIVKFSGKIIDNTMKGDIFIDGVFLDEISLVRQ